MQHHRFLKLQLKLFTINLLNEYFKYIYIFFLNKQTVQKLRIQLHLSFDGRDFFKIFFFYLAQWSLAASWWTERSILLDTWHNCTPCCLVPCKFVIVFLFLNGKYRFSVQSLSLDFEYFAWFHRFLILFLYFTLWSRCTVARKRGKKKRTWFLQDSFSLLVSSRTNCWVIVCFEMHLFFFLYKHRIFYTYLHILKRK